MFGSLLLIAGISVWPMAVYASCLDDVDTLAKKYHVAATLPQDTSSGGNLSQKLAQSGGVIAPPPTGDLSGATPPVPGGDHMQTAPAIMQQGATPLDPTAAAPEHSAAADTQAASLLQAARDAAKNGDEDACQQRLADARKVLAGTGTTTQ